MDNQDIGLLKNGMITKTQFAVNYVQRVAQQRERMGVQDVC